MRIRNDKGEVIGTVTGTLSLHSDNLRLRGVWEDAWQKIKESDPDSEAKIQAFLEKNGYHIE